MVAPERFSHADTFLSSNISGRAAFTWRSLAFGIKPCRFHFEIACGVHWKNCAAFVTPPSSSTIFKMFNSSLMPPFNYSSNYMSTKVNQLPLKKIFAHKLNLS